VTSTSYFSCAVRVTSDYLSALVVIKNINKSISVNTNFAAENLQPSAGKLQHSATCNFFLNLRRGPLNWAKRLQLTECKTDRCLPWWQAVCHSVELERRGVNGGWTSDTWSTTRVYCHNTRQVLWRRTGAASQPATTEYCSVQANKTRCRPSADMICGRPFSYLYTCNALRLVCSGPSRRRSISRP